MPAPDRYTLYGTEFSLYTGKARAYLRYKGIPFREVLSTLSVYRRTIVPGTGVSMIPVVETPEGGQKSVKLFLQFEVFGDDNVPLEAERGVKPALLAEGEAVAELPESPCFLPYAGTWYDNQFVFDLEPTVFDRASAIEFTALAAPVRRL